MKSQPLRCLVGSRVSVMQGPQKVSHLAQQEVGAKWVADHSGTVVHTIEDLGVSATVSPFDRPDLGPWLAEDKRCEWDALVFSKLDRLFRSTRDCVKFAEWAEQHKKMLVFAEDGLTLNYRADKSRTTIEQMMAELFVYLGSFFAELELNRFKTRALDGQRMLRQTDRWASGTPPFGYRIADHPGGAGKTLRPDDEQQAVLHEAAERLCTGETFIAITEWLNTRYPSRRWYVSTVVDILTSPRTQGFKLHRGEVVLDGAGEPIRVAPPMFDHDTWKQIQAAASLRKLKQRIPTGSINPMLGVGVCGCTGCPACESSAKLYTATGTVICGATLSLQVSRSAGSEYRYYRCGRSPRVCRGQSIPAEAGDELLETTFLDYFGHEQVTRRVFVPGEDHSPELEQVLDTIDRLRREADAGLVVTADDEQTYHARMRRLIARRTELERLPSRPAGWVTETTGELYRDVWPGLTDSGRRDLLVDRGIKFVVHTGKPLNTGVYVDLGSLQDPAGFEADRRARAAVERERHGVPGPG